MRDHLLSLQEIDVALSKGDFETAAYVAEHRLGMSSLELHGASTVRPAASLSRRRTRASATMFGRHLQP